MIPEENFFSISSKIGAIFNFDGRMSFSLERLGTPLSELKSARLRPKAILIRVAVVALFASTFAGVPATVATAKTVYPSLSWSEYGLSAKVNGNANVDFFQCGLLVCTDTDTVYGRVGRIAGATNNLARVKLSTTLDGVGATVSVTTSSAGLGFVATSKSCTSGYFNGQTNVTYTSVSFGTQEICYANSAVYLAAPTYSVTGGLRVGSSWTARTATAS